MTTPAGTATVLVIGAGFSRSISGGMPLVDEMGNEAASIMGLGPTEGVPLPFTHGDFEVWLSRQSQPQPYRSAAEDADAHARFLRFTEGITQVIDERVEAALADAAPGWLIALVRVLHARQATVLTFNYDPLIECAIEAAGLQDWEAPFRNADDPPGRRVGYRNVLADGEARLQSGTYFGRAGVEDLATFHLLKLHGSTTWYAVPGDTTGATLARVAPSGRLRDARPGDRRRAAS